MPEYSKNNSMQAKNYSTMGLEVPFNVPSTVEEFDQLGKAVGTCLAEAINNIVYRSVLAEFRDTFLHGNKEKGIVGVEEQTGIKRKVKTVELTSKNEDGSVKTSEAYDETESVYFKRVLAETGRTAESFQDHANAVAASIAFDPSRTEREAKAKKCPAQYLKAAQAKVDAGEAEKLAAKLGKKLGREVATDVESLGWAIKEFSDRQVSALTE